MSNIDLVLLGLIKQKSQSAYDIKKNIVFEVFWRGILFQI